MPEGIDVSVADGSATIEFVDQEKRGPGLTALFEHVDDPSEVVKRTGPDRYIAPEPAAAAAGLLDGAEVGQFVQPIGVEANADGEWTELVAEDTGGPYTELPAVENPDGTTDLEPVPAVVDGPPADHVVGEPESEPSVEGGPLIGGEDVVETGQAEPSEPTEEQSEPATEDAQEPAAAVTYDDGKPDSDWKRDALEKFATEQLGFEDASQAAYSNREKLLAAINEEIARREAAEQAE